MEQEFIYYRYNPSLTGAVIFIVLFGALILWETFQCVRSFLLVSNFKRSNDFEMSNVENPFKDKKKNVSTRYIYVLIPFYIGLLCEFVGYIGRVLSHDNVSDRATFALQTLLILIGPPLFSASIYMIFGRMVTRILVNESYLLIRAKYITKLCVVGDVISLVLQAIGGIIISGADDDMDRFNLGKNIILGGLAVQIVFFGFFVIVELTYYIRLKANLDTSEYNVEVINQDIRHFPHRLNNWKTILESLFICSIFILIRSVFRIVEFTEKYDGYIGRNEWFIYVFDALMMICCAVLFLSQDISNYFLKTIPVIIGKH